MSLSRNAAFLSLAVLTSAALAPSPSRAGLFGSSKPEPVTSIPADPVDFAAIKADPASQLKENVDVDTTGKGIKGLKKVAIAGFQVRFRKDLNNDAMMHAGGNSGDGVSATASMKATLDDDKELFQKLTDGLYDKFVADLKEAGLEVVDISALAEADGYKRGREKAKENGRVESLASNMGVGHRELYDKKDSKASLLSKLKDVALGVDYYIHYAAKAPELIYPHSFSKDATGFIGSADVRLVEPGPLSPGIVDAAQKAGVGLLLVGYEVRNLKYDKGGGGYSNDVWTSAKVSIDAAPMMRTQLLAVKMTKEGATSPTFYSGVESTLRASDGLQITPATRKAAGQGLIGNGKVYRWIESTGTDPKTLLIGSMIGGVNHVKPGPGYEAAFWEAMDAQRALAVAAIKKQL